jgi:RNA polymerase sigma factor (sigma-70 family)
MQPLEQRSVAFVTTQWTRVLQARGGSSEAALALSELCEAYYQPVLAFIRCSTRDDELARDLTQDFFARLLSQDHLAKVDPLRGRFRSYLLAAVKNFLRDAHARDHAAKRNAGQPLLPLSQETSATTVEHQIPDPHAPAPKREFDRKWALALLDRTLTALAAEQSAKAREFEILKPWLTGDAENQAAVAQELGMSEGTVRVAIHRLRQRFRALLKNEIAATLHEPSPALISEEMQYLISVLC